MDSVFTAGEQILEKCLPHFNPNPSGYSFTEVFIVRSPKFHKGDVSQGCIVLNIQKN